MYVYGEQAGRSEPPSPLARVLGVGRQQHIVTYTGVPQGDCLSAFFFCLYLVRALKPTRIPIENEHNYNMASKT